MRSPYLQGLKSYSDNAQVPTLDGAYLLEFSDDTFHNIVEFLKYSRVNMTAEDYEAYELLGFCNVHGYPLEYFRCKLQDRYNGDHLVNAVQLRGDEEDVRRVMTIVNEIFGQLKDRMKLYIHPETVLKLLREAIIDEIELVFISPDASTNDLEDILNTLYYHHDTHIERDCTYLYTSGIPVVFKHVMYESVHHLLKSQTVDCLQLCYDVQASSVICTNACKYSLDNQCNWVSVNPGIITTDYTNTLIKCSILGLKVMIPGLDECRLNLKDITRRLIIDYMLVSQSSITLHEWSSYNVRLTAIRLQNILGLGEFIDLTNPRHPSYHLIKEITGKERDLHVMSPYHPMTLGTKEIIHCTDNQFLSIILNRLVMKGYVPHGLSDSDRLVLASIEGVNCLSYDLIRLRSSDMPDTPNCAECTYDIYTPEEIEVNPDYDLNDSVSSGLLDLIDTEEMKDQYSDGLTSERYSLFGIARHADDTKGRLHRLAHRRIGCVVYNVRLASCLVDYIPEISLDEYMQYSREGKIIPPGEGSVDGLTIN